MYFGPEINCIGMMKIKTFINFLKHFKTFRN